MVCINDVNNLAIGMQETITSSLGKTPIGRNNSLYSKVNLVYKGAY